MGMFEEGFQSLAVGPPVMVSFHPPGVEAEAGCRVFAAAVKKVHDGGIPGIGKAKKIIQGILGNQAEVVELQVFSIELPPSHYSEISFGCEIFWNHPHGFGFVYRGSNQGKASPAKEKLQVGKLSLLEHGFREIRSGCVPMKKEYVPIL